MSLVSTASLFLHDVPSTTLEHTSLSLLSRRLCLRETVPRLPSSGSLGYPSTSNHPKTARLSRGVSRGDVIAEAATSSSNNAADSGFSGQLPKGVIFGRRPGTGRFVVREARPEEYWEVADTHCSAFYPNASPPTDALLRIDWVMGMVGYQLAPPQGVKRACLVAFEEPAADPSGRSGRASGGVGGGVLQVLFAVGLPPPPWPPVLQQGAGERGIEGTVCVDTAAEFLPRKNLRRRQGVAYVSNMAVRLLCRRRGRARQLLRRAEGVAREWGCRAIALHVDVNDPAASGLYRYEGYRVITPPEGARWPQPMPAPGASLQLMLKVLGKQQQA